MTGRSRPVQVLDASAVVVSDDSTVVDLVDRLLAGLPTGSVPTVEIAVSRGPAEWDVHQRLADGTVEHLGSGTTVGHVLDIVSWALNRLARTFAGVPVVHAAVVAGVAGAALLCATSGTGKSTFAAAAACRGWTLASDDLAPLCTGDEPEVVPYPRPVTLRPGTQDLLAEWLPGALDPAVSAGGSWYVAPGDLGAVVPDRPLGLRHVFLLDRGPTPSIEPLSRAATLHVLVTHCVTLADDPAGHLDRLEKVARVVPGSRLVVDPELRALDLAAAVIGAPVRPVRSGRGSAAATP